MKLVYCTPHAGKYALAYRQEHTVQLGMYNVFFCQQHKGFNLNLASSKEHGTMVPGTNTGPFSLLTDFLKSQIQPFYQWERYLCYQ